MTEDLAHIRKRTFAVAGALVVVGAGAWLAWTLRNLLFMVFVAVFVAVAFEPPVHTLEKRGWKRGAATGVVFLAAFALIVAFLWLLAPLFVEQIRQLVEATPDFIAAVAEFLREELGFEISEFDPEAAGESQTGLLQSLGGTLAGGVLGLTAGVIGFFVFATTVALFSFYMVAELPKKDSPMPAAPDMGGMGGMGDF